MTQGPYRPAPSTSEAEVALARLAAEGKHRILEASANEALAEREADEQNRRTNVRAALGAHYGSPVRKASTALFGLCVLLWVVSVASCAGNALMGDAHHPPILSLILPALSVIVLLAAIVLRTVVPPMASRARVAAETTWARSLPFEMDGYFDLVAGTGNIACHIVLDLQWAPGRAPGLEIVQGTIGVLDTDARARDSGDGRVSIRSAAIPCAYERAYSNQRVVRGSNRQLVAYTHRLVDSVLLPLHGSHAIARLTLKRDDDLTDDEIAKAITVGALVRKW